MTEQDPVAIILGIAVIIALIISLLVAYISYFSDEIVKIIRALRGDYDNKKKRD